MANLYDLMLLIDPAVGDERRQQILSEVQSMIDSSGTIVSVHDWGQRRIAYEIDHKPEAAYHLFQFEGDRALLDTLAHNLRISDGVIRHRVIRQPHDAPPVPPSPEQPRLQPDSEEPEGGRVAARAAADAEPEPEPAPAE